LATIHQETISLGEEVDRLNSLDRIEYVATNKLKMVKPESKDVVVVRADLTREGGSNNAAGMVGGLDSPRGEKQAQENSGRSRIVHAFANLMGIKGS